MRDEGPSIRLSSDIRTASLRLDRARRGPAALPRGARGAGPSVQQCNVGSWTEGSVQLDRTEFFRRTGQNSHFWVAVGESRQAGMPALPKSVFLSDHSF